METATQNIDLKNLDKSTWKTCRFDQLAQKVSETVDPNTTDLEIYVGLEHIDAESIHLKRKGVPSDVSGGKLKCYPGDVIFGKRRAYQRKAAIVDFEGICSAHAFVLRANPDVINPDLFPFFLHSDLFMHCAVDISVGGLSPTINWGQLKEQEFLLPPKDQQAQLAKLLWAMDEVIEKEKDVLDRLVVAYTSTIEKKIIDKNSNKIYFKNLGKLIRGVGFKPKDLLDEYSENAFVLLRSNNISDSKVNYEKVYFLPLEILKNDQQLLPGDFALCMSNGSKDLVGKAAKFNGYDKMVSIGSFCAGFRPKDTLSGEVIHHLFASESYRQAIKRILSGSAINNLKPSDIEDLYLRLNFEGSNFKSTLKSLNSMVTSKIQLESKIASSQSVQKSLINQVF
jgi:restriction endonuclease S subunit